MLCILPDLLHNIWIPDLPYIVYVPVFSFQAIAHGIVTLNAEAAQEGRGIDEL